jgi:hypothetical protein
MTLFCSIFLVIGFYDGDSRVNAYKIQFFEQLTGTQLMEDVWLGSG